MRARFNLHLRHRIFAAATLLFVTLSLILGVVSARYADRAATEAYDHLLAAAAMTIAEATRTEAGRVIVDLPQSAFAILGQSRLSRVFWRVESPEGVVLSGYPDLSGGLPPPKSASPAFLDADYNGTPLRLVSVGRRVATAGQDGWAAIILGETREAREALSAGIFRQAALGNVLLTGLALMLVHLGLRRFFAPFEVIRSELAGRTPQDLSPLTTPVPLEAAPMLGALNDFMGRLTATLQRQRQLSVDAAHQVRTPLAALRAQAELALEEPDGPALRRRLTRIHANAVAASQIVSQLLSEATLAHRRATTLPQPCDIAALLAEVVPLFLPPEGREIQVNIAQEAQGVRLAADPPALREMLRNLIDNALCHGAGNVSVALKATDGALHLTVDDAGPGIPEAERTLVLRRFQRGSTAAGQGGSGLGLAIARDAAMASGGTLTLSTSPEGGLRVTVAWPLLPTLAKGAA